MCPDADGPDGADNEDMGPRQTTGSSDEQDRQLARACAAGDPAAMREVYDRTIGMVWSLLLRMTRDADLSADLAQQTYLRVFSAIAAFDAKSSLSTWIYRIAVNEALMHRRSAARYRQRLAAHEPTRPSEPRQQDEPEAPGGEGVDLEALLAPLEPIERAIVVLAFRDGRGYREIAQIVGKPLGTVASTLNRLRKRLRDGG